MAPKWLLAGFLVCLLALPATHAAPSAEETALRRAITNGSAASFSLTKDIVLTQDLPPLADKKRLTVSSASIRGAPFKIDGAGKYKLFRAAADAVISLSLNNLILTRSPLAVELGADTTDRDLLSKLDIRKVKFVNNVKGILLDHTQTFIEGSEFSGHTSSAIDNIDTRDDGRDLLKIVNTKFSSNKVPLAQGGGGAIQLRRYTYTVIEKSTFVGNSAEYRGGAVWLRGDDALAVITSCEFTGNTAGEFGGAVSIFESGIRITSSIFKNNVAKLGGGAIRNEGYQTWFKLCNFVDNISQTPKGGGAFLHNNEYGTTLCQCTFSGNKAGGNPNNIYIPKDDLTVPEPIATNPPVNIPLVVDDSGRNLAFTNRTGDCKPW